MTNSNKSKRIVNFIIDFGVIVIVSSLIYVFTSNSIAAGIIIWIIFLLYYILMEAITGKTLGKRITKTRVVDLSGSKPKPGWILIRTFLRCNPFDAVSYLFGNMPGTHDLLSKTKVVDNETKHRVQNKNPLKPEKVLIERISPDSAFGLLTLRI